MTKVITVIATNICIFWPTDFASGLCQELGISQAIWCLYFLLFLSWSTMRNNVSYVTSILYRFYCLVYVCPSFVPSVVNHLICNIVLELCRVPVILPLTSLTNIVGINIIHSKYWISNSVTPILGKLTLQLEIILPRTVDLINIRIYVIISFSNPWLIDLKLNANWIYIGTIIHLSKPVPWIWHTRFQGLGVRN